MSALGVTDRDVAGFGEQLPQGGLVEAEKCADLAGGGLAAHESFEESSAGSGLDDAAGLGAGRGGIHTKEATAATANGQATA